MSKLTFYGLRVCYLLFLLCIPDYTAHARAAREHKRLFTNGHQLHVTPDEKEKKELKEEVSRLIKKLQHRRLEKELAQKKLEAEKKSRQVVPVVKTEQKALQRSSRSWAAALTFVSASAQAACVAVILSNMGCGGLQKEICKLRKEVAQLRDDLAEETTAVMKIEDRYESLRDLASIADANNDNIVRKLEDSVDMSQKYLKLLSQVQNYVGTLPVVTPKFFSLDSEINKYIIDLNSVPATTSSKTEAILWGATLGLELLPFLGATLQKGYYKLTGTKPAVPEYSAIIKRQNTMYGLKGMNLFQIDSVTKKPIKQVSLSKLQGGKYTYVKYNIAATQKTSKWQQFTGKFSSLANSAIVKCMTYVFQVAAIALCTWQIVDIIQKNNEAKKALTEQKQDLTGYLAEIQESKAQMEVVVDQVESQVSNHSENFMVLNEILLASRTFSQVGTESDRQKLININKITTDESNLRSHQDTMYAFLNQFYIDLKNAYNDLRKYDQIALDVKTDSPVSAIKHKLEALSIPVTGELEIYQIIAQAYPDKIRYDGINLVCIRDGTISTEDQLTATKTQKAGLPQNVVSQITSMALGMAPVETIINVVNMRFQITPTRTQVLESIAKDEFFKDKTQYQDYMGNVDDLNQYRGASCS